MSTQTDIPDWLGASGAAVDEEADLPPVTWATPAQHLEPVEIEHRLVCQWKQKPCATCGKPKSNKAHRKEGGTCAFKRRLGCERCGKPKASPDHVGAPESFNLFASGSWEAYQSAKKRWHAVLAPLLRRAGLPKGLGGVSVEGVCTFPTRNENRDQGNHRVVIEKALGDVLVEEGYLSTDSWEYYEFGGLQREEQPGVSGIRLMLFPRPPAASDDHGGEQTSLLPAG